MTFRPFRATRTAVTLVELLIGLAVVVACAMLAWPVVSGAFKIHRLRNGGDTIQTVCAEARLSAITSGQIHAFRFRAESPYYLVEAVPQADQNILPDLAAIEAGQAQGDMRPDAAIDWEQEGRQLPDGVLFVAVEDRSDQRDAVLNDLLTTDLATTAKPLLFYPDGTTSNATIILHNEQGYFLEIVLDGLAGTVSVSEPQKTKTIGGL